MGGEVVAETARRLAGEVREGDTLARLGGDEYVMLVEDFEDREQVGTIGQRVLARFNEPVSTIIGDIPVSASVGVHVATDQDDYDTLLRAADHAMYEAKRSGPGGIRYSPGEGAR